MLFEKFADETVSWWTKYLKKIEIAQTEGKLSPSDGEVLFPNIILLTNCSGYYVAELIGATKHFKSFSVRRHKEMSIYRYLSQFDDDNTTPAITLDGPLLEIRFVCLSRNADFDEVKKRFPQIELYGTRLNSTNEGGSPLSFGENFVSCAIENSILINKKESLIRCKNILAAYVVKNNIQSSDLQKFYEHTTRNNQVKGVNCINKADEKRLVVSGQLQSMYLFPGLRETTIGEFIALHPDILKIAFKTDNFVYEPYLEWLEHDGTCGDKAINPDLIIRRQDGYYDIYDLKTALLDKNRITKAHRNRRRFIDYVEEGISQLANYREYFQYPGNAAHAKAKFSIEVKDPKLVLVVGSWENVDINEVNQACRRYDNIQIIDYDTLCHLFIGAVSPSTIDANSTG